MTPIAEQTPKEMLLELHELEHDTATQSRVAIDPETVERYGELMRDGVKFDPITVFYDGVRYWVADGWHRSGGAGWASKKSIACLVYQGTKEDAVLYSTSANARHGKAMTNADKRKCVETVLGMRPEWSDRAIADHVGVGHQLVGTVRRQLDESSSSTDGPSLTEQLDKRLGRDGKMRPATQPAREYSDVPTATDGDEGDDEDPLLELMAEPYREAVRLITRAVSIVTEEAEDPQRPYLRDCVTRITTDLQNARSGIRNAEPVEFCLSCEGDSAGCKKCRHSSYLSRAALAQRGEAGA